jgi:hypothetical protein
MRKLSPIMQSVMKLLPIEVQGKLLPQLDTFQIMRTNQYHIGIVCIGRSVE